ncbi:phage portal protein, partial [Embleya sp. NPDC001921]
MAFVVSSGQLQVTGGIGGLAGTVYGALPLSGAPWEFAEIWRCQPQVRTVVSFLARNIASIGLHLYRRVSDTDRERLAEHPLALLLSAPMPRMTRYRLIERLVSDIAIYDEAFWIKLRLAGSMRLLPVPPTLIRPAGGTWIAPSHYETAGGRRFEVDEVVHFHGYTPDDLRVGSSSIESLRALLMEERESSAQRAAMWRNGARTTGVLTRPADAEEWSPDARRRF